MLDKMKTMNAIATKLIQLGTLSSLVLLALPATTAAVAAGPVSVNWDALKHVGLTNAPIVLNPANGTAPTPAVPLKTKTFKLTAPKLLNPKNKSILARKPIRTTAKKETPEALRPLRPAKPAAKKITKNTPNEKAMTGATMTAAPKSNAPSASTRAPKASPRKVAAKPVAPKTTVRAAPTKRIPTQLPTAQASVKEAPISRKNYADIMQENLALLPAPLAQSNGHWGSEPANKTLPVTQIKGFDVATFGSAKLTQATSKLVQKKVAHHAASNARKPTKTASPVLNANSPITHQTITSAIEETARELAAIEDTPKHTKILRSPEPAAGRIIFDAGSTQLMSSGRSTLAALAKKLNQSAARIQLKAYSSQNTLTSVSAQRRLSLRRAMAVRKHLTTEFGISSSRIDVRVLGTVEDSGPEDRVDIVMTAS